MTTQLNGLIYAQFFRIMYVKRKTKEIQLQVRDIYIILTYRTNNEKYRYSIIINSLNYMLMIFVKQN